MPQQRRRGARERAENAERSLARRAAKGILFFWLLPVAPVTPHTGSPCIRLPPGGNGLFYYLRPHGIANNPRGITYIKKTDRQIRDEGWGEIEAGGKYVTDLLKLMPRVWNPETREWLRVREELDRKRRQHTRCCSCTRSLFAACSHCKGRNRACCPR